VISVRVRGADIAAPDPAYARVQATRESREVIRREPLGVRYLPPAFSPIPADAFWGALREEIVSREDPRPRFATHLREHYKADCAALFGSGTQALAAGIRSAQRLVGGNTPVAIPAYACFDVASAAVATTTRIALYDVHPETLTPCLDSLAAALSAGARIVVVASLWGISPDWDEIDALVASHGGVLIEDAAQGMGASWRAQRAGTHGPLSVLSFGRGKGWTGGAGGALLARGDAVEAVPLPNDLRCAPVVSGLMRVAAQRMLGSPDLYAVPAALPFLHLGETHYRRFDTTRPISTLAVRILQRTWSGAHREAAVRRKNARKFSKELARMGEGRGVHPHPIRPMDHTRAGYLRFPVRVLHGWKGIEDKELARHAGVAPGYPASLADIPDVRDRMAVPTGEWRWPGAETLVRELVTLPTHSYVTDTDRAAALRALGATGSPSPLAATGA
jgi:perosamine synthetase